ncbi:hypothetical protein BU23DRAFT_162290 [Bimuria novae-zelandiae CBS 107.79]|uniref:Uncharacterized protein n=1 Tax=Bimuria novae-zelandiae CBS 107.79 TaxID=1447943 RepID=A0A6A5V5L4_9PLEO|nr:hypothetical protein BU23DRAFT_162290 [Bimuria novae-zelandiae CBS 107.79]
MPREALACSLPRCCQRITVRLIITLLRLCYCTRRAMARSIHLKCHLIKNHPLPTHGSCDAGVLRRERGCLFPDWAALIVTHNRLCELVTVTDGGELFRKRQISIVIPST